MIEIKKELSIILHDIAKYCETSTITGTKEFPIDSPDFRQKIVELILDKKITSTQLYKNLKISTIHQWIKKYKDTGNLERNSSSAKKPKIDEKFKKIDNPNATQKELGQLYVGAS